VKTVETTLTFEGADSIYDFLVFEEIIGASQLNTGEKFLLIRGKGVVQIDKNFEFTGKLRQQV
jgi:hypothetical protein